MALPKSLTSDVDRYIADVHKLTTYCEILINRLYLEVCIYESKERKKPLLAVLNKNIEILCTYINDNYPKIDKYKKYSFKRAGISTAYPFNSLYTHMMQFISDVKGLTTGKSANRLSGGVESLANDFSSYELAHEIITEFYYRLSIITNNGQSVRA